MRPESVLLLRTAITDMSVNQNQRRPLGFFLRRFDRLRDLGRVIAVGDGLRVPAVGRRSAPRHLR